MSFKINPFFSSTISSAKPPTFEIKTGKQKEFASA